MGKGSSMVMAASSIGDESDRYAGGGSFPEARADVMEPRSNTEDMEPRSIADDIKAHGITRKQSSTTAASTSYVNKCEGKKYRIMMKGPACHGQACCGGI